MNEWTMIKYDFDKLKSYGKVLKIKDKTIALFKHNENFTLT